MTEPLRIETIDDTPPPRIRTSLVQTGYSVVQALAELISNVAAEDVILNPKPTVLIDFQNNVLEVRDHERGMTKDIFEKAVVFGHDMSKIAGSARLRKFGLGMKMAIGALVRRDGTAETLTTTRDDPLVYGFKWDLFSDRDSWKTDLYVYAKPYHPYFRKLDSHGTVHILKGLNCNPSATNLSRWRKQLGWLFYPFFKEGFQVIVNGKACRRSTPASLKVESQVLFLENHLVRIELHLLERASMKDETYGLNLYGEGDRCFALFDTSMLGIGYKTSIDYRIFGEVHGLGFVPLDHTKQDFDRNSSAWHTAETAIREWIAAKKREWLKELEESAKLPSESVIHRTERVMKHFTKVVNRVLAEYFSPEVGDQENPVGPEERTDNAEDHLTLVEIETREEHDLLPPPTPSPLPKPTTERNGGKHRKLSKPQSAKRHTIHVGDEVWNFKYDYVSLPDLILRDKEIRDEERLIVVKTNLLNPIYKASGDKAQLVLFNAAAILAEFFAEKKGDIRLVVELQDRFLFDLAKDMPFDEESEEDDEGE